MPKKKMLEGLGLVWFNRL